MIYRNESKAVCLSVLSVRVCVGGGRQSLMSGLLSDSGVNNTLGLLCVSKREPGG